MGRFEYKEEGDCSPLEAISRRFKAQQIKMTEVCSLVNRNVCRRVKVWSLFVGTFCKNSINTITNPDSVNSYIHIGDIIFIYTVILKNTN
jgi:hypothetical protein